MGKPIRKRPMARISRSGLWLLGALMLLSVAVLAWALQNGTAAGPSPVIHRSARVTRPASRQRPGHSQTRVVELAERPPSVGDYGPLLQDNVFQPRVVSVRDHGTPGKKAARPSSAASSSARLKPAAKADAAPSDAWNGWKFDGIAQLDQQPYALMEQPAQKQSHFVKVGDPLDTATMVSVADNEVALRQADGSIVRVKRVDPMADMLRAAPATAASTTAAPGAPANGAAPASTFPGAQLITPGAPASPAAGNNSDLRGSFGRRGRRFQQPDASGNTGQP